MSPRPTEFAPEHAGAYFRDRGVVPADVAVETRSLGGGVSNQVVEVRWDGGCLVAKRPLANLDVEDDWPADVQRVHNEAAAARAYASVIDELGLDARTPKVRFENERDHVIGLECAPADAVMWKRELLDGRVDVQVSRAVGRLLAAVHSETADDAALRERFASGRPFEQLRIEPYHRTTAERHPDVADAVQAEVERVTAVKRTLVHGDYSPKNVLVDRSAGAVPWVLDFEVAHWGDPAFDVAFMLNHLFIKSLYNHDRHGAYQAAAWAFWRAYDRRVPWDVEPGTVSELGVLMLARVDGKSPVEYLDDGAVAAALRSVAKDTLTEPIATLEAFSTRFRTEAGRL